jgi:hypothetical protein
MACSDEKIKKLKTNFQSRNYRSKWAQTIHHWAWAVSPAPDPRFAENLSRNSVQAPIQSIHGSITFRSQSQTPKQTLSS